MNQRVYRKGKLIWRTVQRSRAATTTQTAGFQPTVFFSTYSISKKKTRTDDETLDWLLGDIASKLVSIFLTHKENI